MVERDRFGNLHNRRNCISKRNKISLIAQNKRSYSPRVIVYFLKNNILYQRRCVGKNASPLFIHFAIPLTSVSCKATAYDSLRACLIQESKQPQRNFVAKSKFHIIRYHKAVRNILYLSKDFTKSFFAKIIKMFLRRNIFSK